ncbi:MAG: phosphate/phosphite/phosphonate ABC transporter substrate-binding protein [Bacteriovoracaceae bacterium]
MKILFVLIFFIQSCNFFKPEIGSAKKPLNFGIASYSKVDKDLKDFSDLEYFLAKEHDLHVKFFITDSSDDLIYFANNNNLHAIISSAHTFIKHRQDLDYDPILISVRYGKTWYKSEIITHVDSGINTIEDLQDKTFAFTNHDSASGFVIPSYLLKEKNISLREKAFAREHKTVVKLVYLRHYDAGATFYDDTNSQGAMDGRELILEEHPDALKKLKVIQISGQIPNDPVLVKRNINKKVYTKLSNGLRRYVRRKGDENKLYQYYKISDLKNSSIEDFEDFINFVEKIN